ncbi:MAG: DUF418 domain-containing protein [Gammaproteobacteria bacterium]|nr:DUF418 domain-containing protein [Gammaproteobacteria bacterium]
MSNSSPIGAGERIQEIDIIRGFALFGVLWLNLVAHGYNLVPAGSFDNLATAKLDALIAPVADMFVSNKAMALFSLLFGYGFAMIMSRLEARGVDAERVFLRRTAILFSIGIIHIWFIWFGDILHVYALMGFVLFLTRNWSDRSLLIAGLILALFSVGTVEAILQFLYDEPFPWWPVFDIAAERHFAVLQGNSYPAYVDELWWASWETMWGVPFYIHYCATALGRFMLGAWIFRQGWLQNTSTLRPVFRRWAGILIGTGVALVLAGMGISQFSEALAFSFDPLPQLVLALGYAAAIVALCRSERFRNAMRGVAAVGRTALTNYLLQSLIYVFVLFGFGLGLLNVLGATLCFALAVAFFAVQIWASGWWVTRFRFGPVEWLWRSLTYGKRQPFRLDTLN